MTNLELENFLIHSVELSDNETRLYLGLLRKGASTVLEISKYTEINRATVHVNVENLIEKGLVTQTKSGRGKRRQLIAEPPERLALLLEQRKIKLEKTEQGLPSIIQEIYKVIPNVRENTESEIKYYKGAREISYLYSEIVKAKEIRSYVNDENIENSDTAKEVSDMFIRAHTMRKDMQIWEILNEAKNPETYTSVMAKERYSFKFIPKKFKLPQIDYIIFDDKVALTSNKDGGSAVLLSNKEYFEHAKAIFDFIWESI